MYLKKLSLLNYRNIEEAEFEFSDKINCFIGNNGVGKTNILDSIYYMSFCKSWLNSIDNQNINYNADYFMIKGNYFFSDSTNTLSCSFKKGKKKSFKLNTKEYLRLSDHIGLIPLIVISPYDSNIILSGSDERRKFMDITISQFDKAYLQNLMNYNKALLQRNKLLKQFAKNNYFDNSSIDIWNIQLVRFADFIFNKRKKYIDSLIPIFKNYYKHLSKDEEEVSLSYKSQLIDDSLDNLLTGNILKDRVLQYTTCGTHKDDLDFILNHHALKKTASQGQQKTFLIALKLAQFDYIKSISQSMPILLLDDIFDKLDSTRVKQIIGLVTNNDFGQIFISDTNKERLKTILSDTNIDYRIFEL